MNITKITIARLYNLGNYEHVRYELTAEVPEGESAAVAVLGMERILAGLSPRTTTQDRADLARHRRGLDDMKKLLAEKGEEEFRRQHGEYKGTTEEYLARCEARLAEATRKRDEWEARQRKTRKLFEDLGGAANWKDAKLDWEQDYFGDGE